MCREAFHAVEKLCMITLLECFFNRPAALVYYHMAAETGLEVATFNLAYLCELNEVTDSHEFPMQLYRVVMFCVE